MTKQQTNKGNIIPIITMFFLFAMIAFVTNLASPMGSILEAQFPIAQWMGALGVFFIFIAYAVMGYPAGAILEKFGYKKTALIAISVGFIGVGIQTISGFAESFGIYLIGAFISGCSMVLLNTVVNPMLNKLGGGGNRSNQLLQIGGSFNSLAGTAVIIFVGILIPSAVDARISDVFPLMYSALAIFAFAFLVISLAQIPEDEKKPAEKEEKTQYSPLSFRHFVLGALAIFTYVGVEVATPRMLNMWLIDPYLNPLNIDPALATTIAGSVVATYWFLMLVGRLLGAGLAAAISPKIMLRALTSAGIVLVLAGMFAPSHIMVNMPVFLGGGEAGFFGLANVPINALFFVLVGLCTSVMWGSIFTLAVAGLGKYTKKASGIFMIMVCGGGVFPLIQNVILGATGGTGYIVSYWLIVAGLAYMLFYGLAGYKNVNKNIPT